MAHMRGWADSLRSNFFFLPAVAVVVAFVAGRTSVGIDAGDWVGESTVGSARAVLSTVAAATITFASITFSISLLIVQQASSQFSPRLVQALTRDPFNRRVVALVLATFTYCLVALQRIRGPLSENGEEVTPRRPIMTRQSSSSACQDHASSGRPTVQCDSPCQRRDEIRRAQRRPSRRRRQGAERPRLPSSRKR